MQLKKKQKKKKSITIFSIRLCVLSVLVRWTGTISVNTAAVELRPSPATVFWDSDGNNNGLDSYRSASTLNVGFQCFTFLRRVDSHLY